MEDPSYGAWGGRFGQVSEKLYRNTVVDFNPYTNRYEAQYTLSRWFEVQDDGAHTLKHYQRVIITVQ